MAGKNDSDPIRVDKLLEKRTDIVSNTVFYVGYAELGSATSSPVWRIKKLELVGTEWIRKFANNDLTFKYVWDDRGDYF